MDKTRIISSLKKRIRLFALLGGERVLYENQGNEALLNDDPDIPVNARFKMKKNPALKLAYLILETGKHTMICRFYNIRFKIKYEE